MGVQGYEVCNVGQVGADRLDRRHVVGRDAHDLRAAVPEQVAEIILRQPEVQRHEHRPQLRHGVERLELCVCIGRDVGHAVALPHAQTCRTDDQRSHLSKNWP